MHLRGVKTSFGGYFGHEVGDKRARSGHFDRGLGWRYLDDIPDFGTPRDCATVNIWGQGFGEDKFGRFSHGCFRYIPLGLIGDIAGFIIGEPSGLGNMACGPRSVASIGAIGFGAIWPFEFALAAWSRMALAAAIQSR